MGIAAQRGIVTGLLLTVLAGLQGCGILPGTRIDPVNPDVVRGTDRPYAKVYFIRPRTERPMGEADNMVSVALNHQRLLTLVKGEYTVVDLTPGRFTVTVKSLTSMYLKPTVLRYISRSRDFTFSAGNTYYIVMQMVNGEFRGIYNVPVQVEAMKARRIAKYLRPIGKAKDDPINPV